MTAAAPARRIDPVEVFRARCDAKAHLYGAGEIDLHDAAGELQDAAMASGLVGAIGQDAVQAIMVDAFWPARERTPEDVPSKTASRTEKRDAFLAAYRRQWEANRAHSTADCSLGAMQAIVDAARRRHGTAQSTIDALLHSLRRGLSCLSDPKCLGRLAECDEHAIRTIAAALLTRPGTTEDGPLPPWMQDDVGRLLDIWRSTKGVS
jgi:hypothetical protein